METEMIILYATILAGLALAAYKAYKRIMADGEVSLGEIIDLAEDLSEIIKKLPTKAQLKRMKKDELIALCEENGLDTTGVKADLIARLQELE
jgi:hypothetical protein